MKAKGQERVLWLVSSFFLQPSSFPRLPGCTGTLIWKYRASSPAPDSDAISPLASLGAKSESVLNGVCAGMNPLHSRSFNVYESSALLPNRRACQGH